ncbi:hypothetical protein JZ751_017096 [Albula glossodonta]|uniref:Uncharacterized protein n=1 Tax=Albula glossodonta TaxID=121402 RepID=A0A8T2NPD8_9TELE|nr:hypothetical protein JZ751_005420 [Albula glossodonta]KAG9342099.1 hypothetical protein JZ751_017096 [Albula glossodonta]
MAEARNGQMDHVDGEVSGEAARLGSLARVIPCAHLSASRVANNTQVLTVKPQLLISGLEPEHAHH